ncbi:bicarbonate transporter [Tribonema minus]|uniref:Bicarbonate transporter n=1 Tax=Tribonema minus TaxID=303371 RepID=A0A836CJA6_9STRA|nr:bicarbonate transporter [Tribonema minus]
MGVLLLVLLLLLVVLSVLVLLMLLQTLLQRLPLYKDDWKTGFRAKSLSTTAFMYFACLMPAVAFGGFAQQVTGGAMGVVEYLVACGGSGVAYSLFSGQPMTFTGPTGLTLAFITALHAFTSAAALPFLPVYTWCGLWTSALMVALAAGGASNLVRYATQFTDDVFNALIALNFLAEACGGLARNFKLGGAGGSGGALLAVNVAGASYLLTQALTQARGSVYFNKGVREQVSDFGPVLAIAAMTAVSHLPAVSSIGLDFLSVPASFMLQGGRGWLSPLLSVPVSVRLLCLLPALLLTSLFFLDQNISARVVNRPAHKLKKPPAYHQDLLTLGVITGVLSVLGLPWQCAATVQSLNHVRALSTTQVVDGPDGEKQEVVTEVCETRVTGFATHALILMSVGALPLLRLIPMPVVSGMFLYLGRKVMCGNGFFERITDLCMDPKLMGSGSVVKAVGRGTALRYTAVQALMLALLWTLKSFSQTALLFPSVIGLLVVMRLTVLPKLFSDRSLRLLDPPVA